MNALVGAGILSLPNVMQILGYNLFAFFLTLVAVVALFAIDSLLYCCNATGLTAYEAIAKRAYGIWAQKYTCINLWFHSWCACCAYMLIVKEQLPEVIMSIAQMGGTGDCSPINNSDSSTWYYNGDIIMTIVLVFVVLPLASLRRIDFLSSTSAIGMFCMLIFSAIVIFYKKYVSCPLEINDSCGFHEHTLKNSHEFGDFLEAANATHSSLEAEKTCYVEGVA